MAAARRLAAILAADVVGYSRLMGTDEEGTHGRFMAHLAELVEPKISEYRGRTVKSTGDGFLAEFPSVVDAVRCAVEVQRGMFDREPEIPDDRRIGFRIGINVGDVIVEEHDIFGDAVNIAARLEALAEPGGICVSGIVHDQVRDKLDLAFEDMGNQQVKNIARPVHALLLRLGEKSAALPTTTPALPDKPSIAVLPFANMSGDPEQDYFADGMVEEIITALSRIRWLFVIARNSTFTYKGQAVDVKQIGRDLGVRYVLEGSVRKGGNRVRITPSWSRRRPARISGPTASTARWKTYSTCRTRPALEAAETRRARVRPTSDLTAYDLYLRANELFPAWSKEPTLHALELLARAIERDPRYGIALALAGVFHSLIFCSGWADDPDATRRQGIALSQRALQAAGDDPTVLTLVSMALIDFDQDVGPTVGLIDRALALNPGHASGWLVSGWVRVVAGDADRAIADFATGNRLNPRSPSRPFTLTGIGIAHFLARRLEAAAAALLASMQLLPSYVTPYYYLTACYAHMGRLDDARHVFRRLTTLTPPRSDPPVIMPQPPEQRAFFLAGYRLALGGEVP
jgi:adenylate cyclase